MPDLTDEEFNAILNECLKNAIPVTLNTSADEEEKHLKYVMNI